jgi:hypothetical protein
MEENSYTENSDQQQAQAPEVPSIRGIETSRCPAAEQEQAAEDDRGEARRRADAEQALARRLFTDANPHRRVLLSQPNNFSSNSVG